MHAVLFQLKRTYQRSLRISQVCCRSVEPEVTPARFDILHVVARWMRGFYTEPGVVPKQVMLARALGVSSVTVSKMLRRLEELCLIKRERAPYDRRCKLVRLTAYGERVLHNLTRTIVKQGWIQGLFQWGFGAPLDMTSEEGGARVVAFYRELLLVSTGIGDRAAFRYPVPTWVEQDARRVRGAGSGHEVRSART